MGLVERDWYDCYGESWKGIINDDAFAHPAKFSRALIRRIYRHATEQGWLSPGDSVLDPFAGVALGALHAMKHGLRWYGVELEQKFVDLGNRNLELWRKTYRPHMPGWGSAVLVQGDSRELRGVLAEAAVSSPPYADRCTNDAQRQAGRGERLVGINEGDGRTYGNNPAQLGNLPEGDHAASISSPPYARGCQHTGGDDPKPEHLEGGEYHGVGMDGSIASPPYAHNVKHDYNVQERDERRLGEDFTGRGKGSFRGSEHYGNSPGQLGQMQEGEFEAGVSSPPYETTPIAAYDGSMGKQYKETGKTPRQRAGGYLESEHDVKGQEATFWSAARVIMEQVHAALKPGGMAIWVVKAFVRNGERVDFPSQWRQLGEACGFETVEWIRAWLVQEHGATRDLFNGELTQHRKEYKSFFRRLAEQKGAPRIDYEVVLVQRRED